MIRSHSESKNQRGQSAGFPSAGTMMPDFTLVSTSGRRVRISDYRGRCNLVLIFCGKGDPDAIRSFLPELSERYSEFASEEAEVLAVVQEAELQADDLQQSQKLSFPVLWDEEGHAHKLAGVMITEHDSAPVVFIIDRFGEARHICRAGQPACADISDILDWLRYINLECPE